MPVAIGDREFNQLRSALQHATISAPVYPCKVVGRNGSSAYSSRRSRSGPVGLPYLHTGRDRASAMNDDLPSSNRGAVPAGSPLVVVVFEPPPSRAGGPSFRCLLCGAAVRSHEWTRDYDAASRDGLEVRCRCGRRYRWCWGDPEIALVVIAWTRVHANGWEAHVSREFTGDYHYGTRECSSERRTEWAGATRDLSQAQALADGGVPSHRCRCEGWNAR